MSKEALCHSCGEVKVLRECIECGVADCCHACAHGWVGGICPRCQADNPVFFDQHSRTHGEVDPSEGATR